MTESNSEDGIIDLRSDTVTRPSPGMRQAMVEAEVGDHTLGDDPTAAKLERTVAELVGKEASLFFPSGIMANQTAILAQTAPGTEVVVDADAHIVHFEEGAASALAGVQLRAVPSDDGIPDPARIGAAIRSGSPFQPVTSLVCLENTHNSAGGRVISPERLAEVATVVREHGVPIHLDGARLPNASVATCIEMREFTEHVDTVMLSLSKGLGAPAGSMLAGPRPVIERAQRIRRRLGGGMRQVGILAAAALYGLEHNLPELSADHERARRFARRVMALPGLSAAEPETNIVMIHVDPALGSARRIVAAAARRGLRLVEFGPQRIRAVFHLDVDDRAVDRAADVLANIASENGAYQMREREIRG